MYFIIVLLTIISAARWAGLALTLLTAESSDTSATANPSAGWCPGASACAPEPLSESDSAQYCANPTRLKGAMS
jgi:hypothetical protein